MSAREKIANLLWLSVPSGDDDAEAKARTNEMLDAFRAEVLSEAADALSVWPGDQTPDEERPGYDGPTIDAADRLDDALRPMPGEDRAQLIGGHRQMVVGEAATELRRIATSGQAPAPQPEAERIRAERDEVIIRWLLKKAAEYRSTRGPQHALQAETIEMLADKIRRGAARPDNLRMPTPAPQPEPAPGTDGLRERIALALAQADPAHVLSPSIPPAERMHEYLPDADAVMAVLTEGGAS